MQHNEYACGASEPFFNAYAIKSITSLEVTMGLTPTSFRRTKKYKFREYKWFREIFNVQSSILPCKTFKLRIGRDISPDAIFRFDLFKQ